MLENLLAFHMFSSIMVSMNRLDRQKRAQILALMAEGNSIRSITRITGCSKNTVTKFLVDAGQAVAEYQDKVMRNLSCKRLQCDEIWAFCYAKQKNVEKAKAAPEGAGDIWTWVALDADTKLIPSWVVGGRDAEYAHEFMQDLSERLDSRVQLTTDGHKAYIEAVEGAFGANIDYSQLVKIYGAAPETRKVYSPARFVTAKKEKITGNPDMDHASTSHVERQNLTMRMANRRMTRLTNGFSKKFENHCHAMALYFMNYNFVRIHQTLRVTPAMAAGVTDKLWSYEDVAEVVEQWEEARRPKKRGPYNKKHNNIK
jgi:IS1 family transposase